MAPTKIDYDPVQDDKKSFTMKEFAQILKDSVDEYVKDLDGANDFTKNKHTFNEWMATFHRFMSW